MIQAKCNLCNGTGIAPEHADGGEELPCPKCNGTGGWPRATGEPWPSMRLSGPPPMLPVKFLEAVDALKAAAEAHPEFQRMKLQRNIAIAAAAVLGAWSLLCLYLIQKVIERAL